MEIKIQNLVPVEWSYQRVLTSAQIAEVFSDKEPGGKTVTPRHIKQNFANNRDHFIEKVHYFKLEGDDLAAFKNRVENFYLVEPKARILYLWTEAGVFQHAKMLNSNTAWKLYGDLVAFYFRYRDVVVAQPAATVDKSAARRAAQLKPAHVYVALLKNKTGEFVKIGISSEPLKRIKAVKEQTESITCDFNLTSLMPREVSRFIEGLCKEKFSSRRIKSEFFSVNFAEMFDAVKMFTETVLVKMIDGENFAKLKSQVKLLTEPDEDFEELIYRGDLLAGENIFCMAIE